MPKRRRDASDDADHGSLSNFLSWANSFKKVSQQLAHYDLEELLNENDGIIQLTNFLPPKIAEGALQVLQNIPEVLHVAPVAQKQTYPRRISTLLLMLPSCRPHGQQLMLKRMQHKITSLIVLHRQRM